MSALSWKNLPQTSLAFLTGLILSFPVGAALELPDYPLFLTTTGVTPNILLTLDDSGSMGRAFVPEYCGANWISGTSCDATLMNRYMKSSHANPIYYNPGTTYVAPKKADGSSYTTSFTAALRNGFNSAHGTVDLSTSYRPTGYLDVDSSLTEIYMAHYGTDVSVTIPAGTETVTCNTGNSAMCTLTASATITAVNSVQVSGFTLSATYQSNSTTAGCSTRPTTDNVYRRNLSGSTLVLCFQNTTNNMKNRTVTVGYNRAAVTTTYGATNPAPAYYYLFNEGNAGCTGTAAQKKVDNDCYANMIRFVGAQAGPSDVDGDGAIDGDDEKQNFANWYSFYRNRYLATISGASLAFASLPTDSRVAWQSLNSKSNDNQDDTCSLVDSNCKGWNNVDYGSNTIGYFTDDKKTNFYGWLTHLTMQLYTPLQSALNRAADYFDNSGENGPYDNDFNSSSSGEYACRRNFHILMTDGVWNLYDTSGYVARGNVDNSSVATLPQDDTKTPPVTKSYSPRAPYKDSYSNTLADAAFYHWKRDLRPDLNNIIIPSITEPNADADKQYWDAKNNPATWQHIATYTVGLGLSDFIAASGLTWAGDTFSGSYTGLAATPPTVNWPEAKDNVDDNAADLWHAAINSRGRFYSAESGEDIVAAFDDILDTIGRVDSAGGGAALSTNTAIVASESAVYKASFGGDGRGNLVALPISTAGELGSDASVYWEAADGIPATRNILTTNTASIGNGNGEAFADCNGNLATALNRDQHGTLDNHCLQRLNFLRSNWLPSSGVVTGASWSSGTLTFTVDGHGFITGDSVKVTGIVPTNFNGTYTLTATAANTFSVVKSSNPGTWTSGGTVAYADFRNRTDTVLGGITHSAPAYTHDENQGYGNGSMSIAGKDTYNDYVATTKAGRPPMLYVGANDGMLHAFSAPDCTSMAECAAQGAGIEKFAYVPRGVYAKLSKLTDPTYSTTFYVDGSPTIGDAYIGGWKTYLVGSLRGGGKSVFALDISTPESFSAGDVKWEFTDANLWQTYSQPQIGADTASRWVAVFGNGYKSNQDNDDNDDNPNTPPDPAYLYVVNLANGNQINKIGPLDSTSVTNNGLGTPLLYDKDQNGVIDAVYAGDLKGNLWKFVNNNGSWSVGNGGNPLFNTGGQPITVKPTLTAHPDRGVLLYFGTGKYLEFNDLTNTQAQTFYAVWDDPNATPGPILTRNSLQDQSIVSTTTKDGYSIRITTNNTPNWATKHGWYLDLPTPATGAPAERIVSPALVVLFESAPDRVLFVTNVVTSDPCSRGGTSWLMELDPFTGSRTTTSIYDLNDDGKFDDADLIGGSAASGMALGSDYGLVGTPLLLTYSTEEVDENGNTTKTNFLSKAFTGSTGVSGTPTAAQSGDIELIPCCDPCTNEACKLENKCTTSLYPNCSPTPPPTPSSMSRIYWKQIQ